MKQIICFCLILFTLFSLQAQSTKPKLVVGIVVDQMRYEYLNRFEKHYSEDGIKKMINQGFNSKNTHFSYIPTYTAPGHATVFTGTTPANHGIISNNWYDKKINKTVYCVEDENTTSIGVDGNGGKMSPHRMLTTTLGDQIRLNTQFRGKSIGVSLKDRSAVLPAGHSANGAYWFTGGNNGKFISSSFYMDKLPKWVKDFNKSTEKYIQTWNTLKPIETYIESDTDLNNYEIGFNGKDNATFPYDLKALAPKNDGYDILKDTPFGNDMLTDFAMETIKNENLGQDEDTDFLAISYSSTDYVGHNFGVNSKEIQDTYIRLDLNIADLLNFLDETVGQNNYTLFLTADHGAVHVPSFLQDQKIPAGYFDNRQLRRSIKEFVENKFGSAILIEGYSGNEIFFDYDQLEKEDIEADDLQEALYYHLIQYEKIDRVYTRDMIEFSHSNSAFDQSVKNGFHPKRSGDVIYILEPSVISRGSRKGTTHGSYFSYDTQAPLLFYGNGINNGESYKPSYIKDIAPTIAAMLGIAEPNGTTGQIIEEVISKDK
jgi:predicted AlkP superfamily pyrophosphatase or phosphodiesterase